MSELVPNLAKRLLLSTLAMLTSVVTALSIGNPSEASPARSQVQSVVAYAYNSPFFDEPSHGTASERGPPVGYDRTTTYDAVDRWSHGALARHNAAAAGATTIYTISPTLVQTAGATTTTGRHVEVIDGGFRALRADRVAANAGRTGARTCLRSFSGSTLILMADGWKKPIEDVEVGDRVVATDPETGERLTRKVTRVWVHDDQVLDLIVDGEVITTTEDHLFWSVTDQRFERADRLAAGEVVLGDGGRQLTVSGFRRGTERAALAYNLSIAGVHTYHVGDSSVLVHNDCYKFGGEAANFSDDELAQFVYQHVGEGDLAGRPALDQITRVMQRGTPTRIRDDAVQFDHDGVRVIINESMPWRSTAVVRNGG